MTASRISALLLGMVLAAAGMILPSAAEPAWQERILTGTSAEGASVTAYRDGSAIRRIHVEALNETGYSLCEYQFSGAGLVAARVRIYGYKVYPDGAMAPPHRSGIVDRTDLLLLDEQLRFFNRKLIGWRIGNRVRSHRQCRRPETKSGGVGRSEHLFEIYEHTGAVGDGRR